MLAAVLAACSDSDAPSASRTLPPPLGVDRTPAAYHVVYRVEQHAAGDVTVSTERLWVRRPFDARLESAPASGGPPQVDVHVFGRQQTGAVVIPAEPGPPAPDLRPGPALDELVRRGVVERGGRRTIAGRRCDVYRADSVVCLDEAGLILEERFESRGELVRRKVAVEVDEHPAVEDGLFVIDGTPVPPEQGGGAVQRVTDDSRPPETRSWELAVPPSGFTHMGRFVVVLAQTPLEVDPNAPPLVASLIDLYVDGLDVVGVDNGGTLRGETPYQPHPHARPVRLGTIGRGEAIDDLRASQVRARLERGRFVRVYGTLSTDRLAAIARQLERRDGGTITTIPN